MGHRNIKFADDVDCFLKDQKTKTGYTVTALVNMIMRQEIERNNKKNKKLCKKNN